MYKPINQIFLGIDPGLCKTGWAIIRMDQVNDFTYISSGIIKTSTNDADFIRLKVIYNSLLKIIIQYQPANAAIEDTYVNINHRTSLKLSQSKAASLIAMAQKNLHIYQYSPKTVKKFVTGSGNSNKQQVLKAINNYFPTINITNNDESDALAVAMCIATSII